ncbi:MATE family efflux transporter [Flavihumibacter rivuli]|uniref:MATE family efflux transporter n=1 Tax=Flavihumibacter rivuli TaxID=2838156 RepID=UPI001BDEC574|nr:MATE family efflux transporter [Flavihumibacter rivuli]ULQ57727.1 MATE family efflux transporter [Flavihumibacter rivuli]
MSTANSTATDLKVNISNRQILSIALPISFAIFVPQVNFVTNNVFLGGLGEDSLAAAGITGVYYLIFAVIGYGLNNGLQALISRRAGQDKVEEIGKLFAQGVFLSLTFAAFGILLTYLVATPVLQRSLHSPELTQKAVSFLHIRIWGLPFLYLYQMRNALLVGTNQSKYLVWGTLAETLGNIFFDYGLIYGKFGMPEIGFNGAAYASIIAEFLGMFVVFAVIQWKGISKQLGLARHFRWNKENARLVLVQSSPLIFQYAISIISWEFFYILIEHHGKRDLAISNTMRNIFGLFGVFTWAFASTSNTMVSNIIGQGMKERVEELIGKIVKLSLSISILLCIFLNLFPALFLSFYGQGEEFVRAAVPVIRIISLALLLMSFATIWLNGVTGTGNTKVNLVIEIVAIVAYTIYAYVVLEVMKLPITYGWMSEWLYWIILFSLSYAYIRSGKWKKKEI